MNGRTVENLNARKRALRMRAGRRGYLEVELVMRPFLDSRLDALTEAEVTQLEVLAELEDLELWEVISGKKKPPQGVPIELVKRIRTSPILPDTHSPDESN